MTVKRFNLLIHKSNTLRSLRDEACKAWCFHEASMLESVLFQIDHKISTIVWC